jgi:hypothetical protein
MTDREEFVKIGQPDRQRHFDCIETVPVKRQQISLEQHTDVK